MLHNQPLRLQWCPGLRVLDEIGMLGGVPSAALNHIDVLAPTVLFWPRPRVGHEHERGFTTWANVRQDGSLVQRLSMTFYGPVVQPTVVHELGHALDVALRGPGESRYSDRLRGVFRETRRFLSEPSRVDAGEWFAEAFRAWCGANAVGEHLSRADVRRSAPALHNLFMDEGLE